MKSNFNRISENVLTIKYKKEDKIVGTYVKK